MKRLILAVMVVVLMASTSWAATTRSTFGQAISNVHALEEKDDGLLYVRPDGGIKYSYEKATTNDTILIGESGKTFIIAPSSEATFTLPTAEVGAWFKFMAAEAPVAVAGGTPQKIIVDVQSTDFFRGYPTLATAATFATGDSIISAGTTGDTLTVFCAEPLYWDIVDIRSTWVDND